MISYQKPYLPLTEQVSLLKGRGLLIKDDSAAEFYLSKIGYYRLSGYSYPFRKSNRTDSKSLIVYDDFKENVSFEDIIRLYVYDKKLRLLMLDAIERIEIALRVEIALHMGKKSPKAHKIPKFLDGGFTKKLDRNNKTKFQNWLDKLGSSIEGSKEDFVKHFKNKYTDNPNDLPIWMAVELWDFGMLSTFFSGMKYEDQKSIAQEYGVTKPELFKSWLHSLNYVRNICAHHSRFWNKVFVSIPKTPQNEFNLPHEFQSNPSIFTKPFGSICICKHMLKHISPSSKWGQRIKDHLTAFPEISHINVSMMGAINYWQEWNFWNE